MARWTGLSASELAAKGQKNRASWKQGAPITYLGSTRQANGEWTSDKQPKKPAKTRARAAQASIPAVGNAKVILPWPPSVNHYWRRNKGKGMHISAEGLAYQAAVIDACRNRKGVMGHIGVHVIAFPPDRRKRDLDNLLKALLDALNHAGMIEDDCLIDDLHIVRRKGAWDFGCVEVEITAL